PDQRGRNASFTQVGPSCGTLIGTGFIALISLWLTPEEFQAWGWRVPFMSSVALVPVGAYIRRNLEETLHVDEPAGGRPRAAGHQPLRRVFAEHKTEVAKGILLMIGGMVCAQIIGFYMPSYAHRELGLPATSTLSASVVVGAVGFL
ncbi:hypothetical protein LZB55_07745, partial [Campylobacter lari]|nr:hypothetical protein [Campylobacter lari]